MKRELNVKGYKFEYEYEEVVTGYKSSKLTLIGGERIYCSERAETLEELDNVVLAEESYSINKSISEAKAKRNIVLASIAGVVVVLLVILFNMSTYNIKNGQQAVLKNSLSGEARVETEAGFSTKLPWEDVNKVSIGEKTYNREDSANTSDNVQLTYNFKVSYKLTDVEKFWNAKYTLDETQMQSVINKNITKSLDTVSNKYDYDYIKSSIASIGDQVTEDVNKQTANYGIEVVGVDIVDIKAPESIDKAINAKIKKQQEAEASKYEVEKAENTAKAQKVKQDSVSKEQQQMELCQNAIDAGDANSPACYFGDEIYVNASKTTTSK